MEINKGQLFVEGKKYRKKIDVNRSSTLKLEEDQIQAIQEVLVSTGETKTEQGSKFISYAVKINSVSEVRNLHLHFKCKYGDATHIIAAYRIAGINKAYDEDYVDDGETSAGRRILDFLIKEDKQNIMVIVIRYYGGVHLGGTRFDLIHRLVKKAIKNLAAEKMVKSRLPLRQLLEINKRSQSSKGTSRRHHPSHPIRGNHRGGLSQRFASSSFNKFSQLAPKTTTEEDTVPSDTSDMETQIATESDVPDYQGGTSASNLCPPSAAAGATKNAPWDSTDEVPPESAFESRPLPTEDWDTKVAEEEVQTATATEIHNLPEADKEAESDPMD